MIGVGPRAAAGRRPGDWLIEWHVLYAISEPGAIRRPRPRLGLAVAAPTPGGGLWLCGCGAVAQLVLACVPHDLGEFLVGPSPAGVPLVGDVVQAAERQIDDGCGYSVLMRASSTFWPIHWGPASPCRCIRARWVNAASAAAGSESGSSAPQSRRAPGSASRPSCGSSPWSPARWITCSPSCPATSQWAAHSGTFSMGSRPSRAQAASSGGGTPSPVREAQTVMSA